MIPCFSFSVGGSHWRADDAYGDPILGSEITCGWDLDGNGKGFNGPCLASEAL